MVRRLVSNGRSGQDRGRKGPGDGGAGGGGQTLRDALTCPSELVRLTTQQGADGRCAGLGQGIWADTVYSWLHRTLYTTSR